MQGGLGHKAKLCRGAKNVRPIYAGGLGRKA